MSGAGSHVVALATPDGHTAPHVPRRTLVWGDNSMGQIGAPEAAEARAVPPRRLLRSLFPRSEKGNVVDSTNRRVCYKEWDAGVVSRSLELETGVRGIKDIATDINTKMGGQYISITTDEDSEQVIVQLRKPGVQFDFKSDSCRALSDRLGFSRGFETPALGLLNEVRIICGQSNVGYPMRTIMLVRLMRPKLDAARARARGAGSGNCCSHLPRQVMCLCWCADKRQTQQQQTGRARMESNILPRGKPRTGPSMER